MKHFKNLLSFLSQKELSVIFNPLESQLTLSINFFLPISKKCSNFFRREKIYNLELFAFSSTSSVCSRNKIIIAPFCFQTLPAETERKFLYQIVIPASLMNESTRHIMWDILTVHSAIMIFFFAINHLMCVRSISPLDVASILQRGKKMINVRKHFTEYIRSFLSLDFEKLSFFYWNCDVVGLRVVWIRTVKNKAERNGNLIVQKQTQTILRLVIFSPNICFSCRKKFNFREIPRCIVKRWNQSIMSTFSF